jgi:hypothetical protein
MEAKTIGYWAATAFIALETLAGGVTDLAHGGALVVGGTPVVDVVTRLGYPVYVLTILGIWKILGAIVLVVPRLLRLKEWAYAGIIFELTGAAASHVARGHSVSDIVTCVLFAALAFASWALRPPSRTLGAASPIA